MSITKVGTSRLLFSRAQQMGLTPVWVTPSTTFAITVDGKERYVNLARSPLNSDASAALARNKYITRCILGRHNMPNIPLTRVRTQADAEVFLAQHGTIVAKPVAGAGAHDIHIVTTGDQLSALNLYGYILEKYITGAEMRYLVLEEEVISVHHSEYGDSVAQDRQLQRISYAPDSWSPELVAMSLRAASVFNLKFAAIDYLVDAAGRAYILEINTMPGLKWFHAPSSGPATDVARLFLESIVSSMHTPQRPLATKRIVADAAGAYN